MTDSYVEALLIEREGYVRRGLAARVAQVDDALKAFGIAVSDSPETATAEPREHAIAPKARKR